MRVLVALGGNAMTGPGGSARPEEQIAAAQVAMASVADLVSEGLEVVITHGNGPQVGNLLVKNEVAASVVPPVPLDWCVAQTQATLGFVLMNALDAALAEPSPEDFVDAILVRRLGIAARFVSGYLFIPGDRAHGYVGGGSTHAWVQVYLPSAGWIEFDPTNGIVGTRDLVRVAVARDPHQAIPLHGTYLGSADAYLGMHVSINVVSVGEEARV